LMDRHHRSSPGGSAAERQAQFAETESEAAGFLLVAARRELFNPWIAVSSAAEKPLPFSLFSP